MKDYDGMVICPDCKGVGRVQPKQKVKGCLTCDGCDCERCGTTGKILWIEEVIRKDIPSND